MCCSSESNQIHPAEEVKSSLTPDETMPAWFEQLKKKLPKECGQDAKDRIFQGKITHIDEFPWTALLEYLKSKFFFVDVDSRHL